MFLDEIGAVGPNLQARLLRALQEGTIRKVGTNEPIAVDVRVVAASNKDLSHAVKEGRFREDLFYRLNVIELDVPPLAERREDILPLGRAFLGPDHVLSLDAERALLNQSNCECQRHVSRE